MEHEILSNIRQFLKDNRCSRIILKNNDWIGFVTEIDEYLGSSWRESSKYVIVRNLEPYTYEEEGQHSSITHQNYLLMNKSDYGILKKIQSEYEYVVYIIVPYNCIDVNKFLKQNFTKLSSDGLKSWKENTIKNGVEKCDVLYWYYDVIEGFTIPNPKFVDCEEIERRKLREKAIEIDELFDQLYYEFDKIKKLELKVNDRVPYGKVVVKNGVVYCCQSMYEELYSFKLFENVKNYRAFTEIFNNILDEYDLKYERCRLWLNDLFERDKLFHETFENGRLVLEGHEGLKEPIEHYYVDNAYVKVFFISLEKRGKGTFAFVPRCAIRTNFTPLNSANENKIN